MEIVYTGERPPESWGKSIFLAGPTPRSADVQSWRPEALELLKASGYDGLVFVPEWRDLKKICDYYEQVDWEHEMLQFADCILFWVPREMKTMPALTTNVEFGWWHQSGKVTLGFPMDAEKMDYLYRVAYKNRVPTFLNLSDTVKAALAMVKNGALRHGGERGVPLHIWNTDTFQAWLKAQKTIGNRLDGAKVEWMFRVGKNRDRIFAWIIHVNIHIAAENRNKTNELILSRFDISSVLLYSRHTNLRETKAVLIKEFRSPAATDDGYIWELPGGSAPGGVEDPRVLAAEELFEETGFKINYDRLRTHGARQLAGTWSAHKAHFFSAEITDEELQWFKREKGIVHGTGGDDPTGECTYVEVVTVGEILDKRLVDWSNIGMILSALSNPAQ